MATGKYGGKSVFFFADGYNLITAKLKGLRFKVTAMTEDVTGLGDSAEAHLPTGLSKAELSQDGGFFDTAALQTHAAHSGSVPTTPQAPVRTVCAGFAGATIGEMFIGFIGAFTGAYEVLAQLGSLTKANVEYTISGQLDRGQILQPLATKTADWDTQSTPVDYTLDPQQRVIPITSNSQANPSVVTCPVPHGLTSGDIILIAGVSSSNADINGQQTATVIDTLTFSVAVDASVSAGTGGTFVRANTADGGVGYQQNTEGSGFTNFVGTIQDSPDDITYATLVAFTDSVSDPVAERVTVSGTVDRYLAYDGNVTGSGTIGVFAGFCRTLPS